MLGDLLEDLVAAESLRPESAREAHRFVVPRWRMAWVGARSLVNGPVIAPDSFLPVRGPLSRYRVDPPLTRLYSTRGAWNVVAGHREVATTVVHLELAAPGHRRDLAPPPHTRQPDDVDARARWRDFGVRVQTVDDLSRGGVDLARRWIAAAVDVDADERVIRREHEARSMAIGPGSPRRYEVRAPGVLIGRAGGRILARDLWSLVRSGQDPLAALTERGWELSCRRQGILPSEVVVPTTPSEKLRTANPPG